jgi:hypothetical protein
LTTRQNTVAAAAPTGDGAQPVSGSVNAAELRKTFVISALAPAL